MSQRLLIVGLGSIGKRHLQIARASLPDADIRILRHQSASDAPPEANGCFSRLDDALAFRPDMAILANPASFHVGIALPLARQGCHLLIEKPLATSAASVAPLLAAALAQGIVLQVGYNLRFLASLADFRQRIAAGEIGQVLSVRCEIGQYLPSWRPDSDYRQGVSARAELGGGVLLELSHELDYLRWVFGDFRWVNAWLGKLSNLEVDVEDTAHLTLGLGPDAQGPVAALNMDFIRRDTTRSCHAIGEQGSLRWLATAGTVDYLGAGGTQWENRLTQTPQRNESYLAQWQHFLACIGAGKPPLTGGKDGLAVLEAIEAARRSAAQHGQRVDIPATDRE
jgi:predicted dehydrogenase